MKGRKEGKTFLQALSYLTAWGRFCVQKAAEMIAALPQPLPTWCCWHLSSRQWKSQLSTPKRRRNAGLSAKACNSLPLHLSQSPSSSSLMSRLWTRSALPPPDLPTQTCHKTFAHPLAEPGLQSILRRTATAVPVRASSFWLKTELAGRHLPMENRLKANRCCVFSDTDLEAPLCTHSDQFYFQ